ncbi:hypothetical protein Tco_0658220 [Tanacetum coccineum]
MEVNKLRAERLSRAHDPLALMANSNNPYNYSLFHQDQPSPIIYMQQPQPNNNFNLQPSFNTNYMQQPMPDPKDIIDPTTTMNMALVLNAKAFKLNYSTPTNNNQRISSNPHNRQIAHLGMNLGQDRQMQMLRGTAQSNQEKGKRDAAFLQTQLLIAQKEKAGIQLQAKEFDFMAAVGDLEEITEMDHLSLEHTGGTVEQNPATVEETRAYFESLHNNLAIEVEKVNSVNRKMKETNVDLTTDLARYKNQEKCFEISQEKYDKLERCYQKSVYQEQCLTKKINVLHLSSAKMIMTLNEEIANLNNQLSKEKSTVSFLNEEKKRLKSDFKIREDELLDKQIQLENKIKESDKADESLAKHKALELEIEHLLRAVVSQDNMSIMQNPTIAETSDLQTELKRTKEQFENCIIKKENEYAKLWNDWYKKSQLGDLKGKSKDTPCVLDTINPLSQKLENENVELEFQVLNYAKENAHLKTTYKNLFDSISVTQTQTKTIIDSLQNKLHDTIYDNAKLRAQLFDKVSEQKDITKGTSANTKFANQSTSGTKLYSVTLFPKSKIIPKVVETNDLSKPLTLNSVPTTTESKVVTNDKVITPGMFRINSFKTSRKDK